MALGNLMSVNATLQPSTKSPPLVFEFGMLYNLHYKDFYLELEREGRTAVVIFTQSRCGTCRRLHQKIVEENPDLDIFIISAETALGLIEEWEVFHLPHILLFKGGQFHRQVDIDWSYTFQELIHIALSAPPQEAPC